MPSYSSEDLKCLLTSQAGGMTGPEEHFKLPADISLYRDDFGSFRFVSHVRYVGEPRQCPVAAIQVMVRFDMPPTVANAYTLPLYRRQGHFSRLCAEAARLLGPLTHSLDRSRLGEIAVAAVLRKQEKQ